MAMQSDDDVVTLVVPARSDFLQLSRLNVAGTLGNAGFSIDEIEDLKIGAEELSATLLTRGTGNRIEVSIRVDEDGATVVAERAADADESIELDEFVGTILDAVVDSFDLASTPTGLRFTMRKRLRDR